MGSCNDSFVNLTARDTSNNCTQTNATIAESVVGYYPYAEVAGWILLAIGVGTVFSNAIFLLVYWRNSSSSLHTPFNVYVSNLAISDFVISIFTTPGNFALFALNRWPFSSAFCTLHLYVYWNWYTTSLQYHMLISLNRLWAICFPHHYRTHHTKRLAVSLCTATCLYAHVWTLIGLIPDALYYRTENERECSVNVELQPLWSALYLFTLYTFPEVVVIVVYPVISWKVAQRRKVKARNNPKSALSASGPGGTAAEGPVRQSVPVSQQGHLRGESRLSGPRTSHFKVLTYLVMANVIFWTPNGTYFVLASTMNFSNFSYYTFTLVLLSISPLITPLTYPLASKDWREAFKRLLVR
ncbi:hypothetical protein RvY_03799 [Ramazzottius varieornatus]|uniref:G-protein coupled receptors family 1 profile domain-containing protein n=1 Tax=Ramazzottius varieornatus TaxID=947166 RepID=A0A1D1UQ48_RAMVA|nr:hypothetical protein RvY_03799 [Ramazzottius varieornatus]